MTQKIILTLQDDIDKSMGIETTEGVRSHTLIIDGRAPVRIDLTDEHWKSVTVDQIMQLGEKTGLPRQRTQAGRARSRQIRQWAEANPHLLNGRELSDRGRIPASVVEAYDRHTGNGAVIA